MNLLTNFAYKLFIEESTSLDLDGWIVFIQDYSREFLVPGEPLDKLVGSGLLKKNHDRVRFSHKYIFYYYAAKHFAALVEERENISPIERLCENLHVEANANVLIFVTHHSRSKRVIEEISLYADEAFAARATSKLSADETRFLAKNVREIPELIIEAKDVEEAREDDAVHQDELTNPEDEDDAASEFDGNKDSDIDDGIFADVASSARTVEIIGQIVRNRHGSLSKSELGNL